MNKYRFIILIIGILVTITVFYYGSKVYQGIKPAVLPSPQDIDGVVTDSDKTGLGLKIAPGFEISVFARNLPGARVMALDSFGNMWVSQTAEGKISLLEVGDDGQVHNQGVVLQGLRKPHGLAFSSENPFALYFAEEDKISWLPTYSEGAPQKIIDLPAGGGHFTRTIKFGPDGRLYVSIGSSCNVCNESDERRAKIFSLKKDGSDFKEFARGLRNAVFFAWNPRSSQMWVTEMGRDWLGDNLPPDEINIIEEGKNYGWPICYGKNIHDTDFDKNVYIRNPCLEPFETASHIDIPAHSAPLGLAFVAPVSGGEPSDKKWPAEYWHNLFVAYHGSWNRSEPTGYKVVRYKLDAQGRNLGEEDFVTGWLRPDGATGRPADILILPNGTMYISDDKAGAIYKVTAKTPEQI